MKKNCGQCAYYQDCIDEGEEITKRTAACEEFEPTKSKKAGGNGKGIMAKNISFQGCDDTLEEVFGKGAISRADVVRIVSAYIRENRLVG